MSTEIVASRPFHYSRKFFHFLGLLIPLFFYFNLLDFLLVAEFPEKTRTILFYLLLAATLAQVLVELLRFRYAWWQQLFLRTAGRLLKEKELQKVHGSLPFFAANTLVIAFYSREIAVLCLVFLSLGDPIAAYFGSRFGTVRFQNGKSLQGTLAGIGGAFFSGLLFLLLAQLLAVPGNLLALWSAGQIQWLSVLVVLGGAVAAFLAELFSSEGWLDDNLTIPLVSGLVMTILASVFFQLPLQSLFFSVHSLLGWP